MTLMLERHVGLVKVFTGQKQLKHTPGFKFWLPINLLCLVHLCLSLAHLCLSLAYRSDQGLKLGEFRLQETVKPNKYD